MSFGIARFADFTVSTKKKSELALYGVSACVQIPVLFRCLWSHQKNRNSLITKLTRVIYMSHSVTLRSYVMFVWIHMTKQKIKQQNPIQVKKKKQIQIFHRDLYRIRIEWMNEWMTTTATNKQTKKIKILCM